jgi:hypothetical protein
MIFSQKRNNFHDEFLNDIERWNSFPLGFFIMSKARDMFDSKYIKWAISILI